MWGQALLDYKYSEGECTHLYASVHFSGKVTLLDNVEEKLQALECMTRQLDSNPEPLVARLNADRVNSAIIGRIDIEYMTGKKSKEVTV